MTLSTLSLIGLGLFLFGMAVYGFCRGGHQVEAVDTIPEPPLVTRRQYSRGMCGLCGEMDVVLRADGNPNEKWHLCRR